MAFHRASGARRQTPAIAASGRRHLLAGVTGIEGGASGLDLREAALSPVDQAGQRPEGRGPIVAAATADIRPKAE
ncbi:hypothetical protein AB7813_20915 [Tardiphaga sp. 20_F10_N6_6]|uniref:hypothetical protein n=1 Tax=Tardiphaga sp. 20_F10_N6_6 TaxID=3240788 RepID=UPI003F89C8AE